MEIGDETRESLLVFGFIPNNHKLKTHLSLVPDKSESEGMYVTASEDHICDECGFFDAESNHCTVTDEERRFDQAACRQFLKAEDVEIVD